MQRRAIMAIGAVLVTAIGCGSTTIVEGDPDHPTGTGSTSASTGGSGGMGGTGGQPGTGGEETTGVGGSGGGPSEGPWRADLWIGQVDHLSIRHHAISADVCLLITATAPSADTTYDVAVPEPWALDMIAAWDDTTGCMDDPFTPTGDPVLADGALGLITFDLPAMQFYPCALDLEMEATFAMAPPWLPPSLPLEASMLEVSGACD